MPFATRCPECRTKLRLEAVPDAGETIECPKCGSIFAPEETAAPEPKKLKKPKKERKPNGAVGPKKRKVKKKKTNLFFLYGMLGTALAFVIGLSVFLWIYLGKAGKVEEMMCYVPGECNVVRGINSGQIAKYSGFASEMDSYVTANVKSAAGELALAVGFEDETSLLDYVVIGKNKQVARNAGTVYVFRSRKSFPKLNPLDGVASMKAADSGGTTYYRSSGRGLLSGAAVFTPTSKLVVVVAAGPQQQTMVSAVAAGGVKNKDKMFAGKAGDTGAKVSAGDNWILVRADGAMKNYPKDLGAPVKGPFPQFASACEKTPVIGWWTSYGSKGIKFGGAVECADSTAAWDVIRSMRNGELGKQDDAEIPSDMKKAVSSSGSKEFREFLAKLSFNGTGKSAYFIATMAAETGKRYTQQFHGANIAGWGDDDNSGGNQGGPGGFGGGGPGGRP